MRALARNESAPAQELERRLDRALGQTRRLCDRAQAGCDRFPTRPRRHPVEVQINEKCRRLPIVPDQVAHENVEHIIIDRDGLSKTGHAGKISLYRWMDSSFSRRKRLAAGRELAAEISFLAS
jgi:hypothetical protein